jgi:hypothetical protein
VMCLCVCVYGGVIIVNTTSSSKQMAETTEL